MNTSISHAITSEVSVHQKTGTAKPRGGTRCEDAVHISEQKDLLFWGIADGQSGKRFGWEGGLACLKAAESFIRRLGIPGLMAYPFPDELPCLLMQRLRAGILALSRELGGTFQDYASTLLVLAVDPASGQYLFAHLGDGCLLSILPGEAISFLSPPENGMDASHTWLTTSPDAVPHMHFGFGTVTENRRFVLMTDGADTLCRCRNIPRQARELLLRGSREEINGRLDETRPSDDSTVILLDIRISKISQN